MNAFAATMVCKSSDFDAANYNGQSLKLEFTQDKLVSAEKMKGSWWCDEGRVKNPEVSDKQTGATVYDVNFSCNEGGGRIVVPSDFLASKTVTYKFGEGTSENMKWVLTCK